MFGTLVSTGFDQESLEYVENPDPVAAVSRNVQDKIRIACMVCRSRKVRCSGGRRKCQRCVTMGLECVYPESQGRAKRQENKRSRQGAVQHNANVPNPIVCDEMKISSENDRVNYGDEIAFDSFQDNAIDDSCVDDSLFRPWIMDTVASQSLGSGSNSSSCENLTPNVDLATSESDFSAGSRSATVSPSVQRPELSVADTTFTSLLRPLSTGGATDLGSWEDLDATTRGDMVWALNSDGPETAGSTLGPLTIQPWNQSRTDSEGCCCLLSSISFLEKLTSSSASRENRIDLLLSEVRNSIETLARLVSCMRCVARVEQNILLAMAARQISVICGKAANCYKAMNLFDDSAQQKPEVDGTSGGVDISVSTYRVNRREMLHLLESLVTLQLVEFQQHINTIKSRSRTRPDQGQTEALVEAENRLKLAKFVISK